MRRFLSAFLLCKLGSAQVVVDRLSHHLDHFGASHAVPEVEDAVHLDKFGQRWDKLDEVSTTQVVSASSLDGKADHDWRRWLTTPMPDARAFDKLDLRATTRPTQEESSDWHKWLTTPLPAHVSADSAFEPTSVPSRASKPHVGGKKDDWRKWIKVSPGKDGAARAVRLEAKDNAKHEVAKRPSEFAEHQRQAAVDKEVDVLKHALGAISYMEERATGKLNADVDEVDHLIVRRHMLTDRAAEADADAKVVDERASALKSAAAELLKAGRQASEADSLSQEAEELGLASASLRGTKTEGIELERSIIASTADGKRMDDEVRRLARNRKAIERQIKALTAERENLEERAETANDMAGFEKAGYADTSDPDDPYMQEASHALEEVTGWKGKVLDSRAADARERMTGRLAFNPGQAVQAMKALR